MPDRVLVRVDGASGPFPHHVRHTRQAARQARRHRVLRPVAVAERRLRARHAELLLAVERSARPKRLPSISQRNVSNQSITSSLQSYMHIYSHSHSL